MLQTRQQPKIAKPTTVYPKHYVEQVTRAAALRRYGEQADALVARHTKVVMSDSLPHIDYTIPCFELAAAVGEPPEDVATELAKMVQAKAVAGLKLEAAGGYLNFAVDDHLLKRAADEAIAALGRHRSRSARTIRILAAGPVVGAAGAPAGVTLYAHLTLLYEMLGWSVEKELLVLDSSEAAVDLLASHLASLSVEHFHKQKSKDVQLARLWSKAQRTFVPDGDVDEDIMAATIDLNTTFLHTIRKSLPHLDSLVYESDFIDSVNHRIDDIPATNKGLGLIRDPDTGAAYYSVEDSEQAVSLRSASGFLYRSAYLLYLLEQSARADRTQPIIVITNQKEHWFIEDYARRLKANVVCIDQDDHPRLMRLIRVAPDATSPAMLAQSIIEWSARPQLDQLETRLRLLRAVDLIHEGQNKQNAAQPLALLERLLELEIAKQDRTLGRA